MMQAQLFLNSISATDANKHYTHTIPSSSLIRESENVQEMKSAAILSGELSREKTAGVCKQTTQQLCSSAQGVLFCLFKHTDTLVSRQSKPAISTHLRRALLDAYTAVSGKMIMVTNYLILHIKVHAQNVRVIIFRVAYGRDCQVWQTPGHSSIPGWVSTLTVSVGGVTIAGEIKQWLNANNVTWLSRKNP